MVSLEEDPAMLLRVFYQRFFPYKSYFQWLNYGPGELLYLLKDVPYF